ncbi:MAG TPA: hypothetical protein VN231_06690 [Allosphingosinicella sp.]|nr:hypothetical protein [Allosphingosinicella sp.]
MNAIMWIHIAGGVIALAAGTLAVAMRKGGRAHALAGTWFFASMLVLGITAAILGPFKTPPDSPIGGLMVCYFVATAWMTARRRDGRPGRFEKIACAFVLGCAGLTIAGGFEAALSPEGQAPGAGALFLLGVLFLLPGLADLNFIRRGKLSPAQRISRHVWRMCVALFIATGSFFLGQQDVMPAGVRGSPILFVLAFAPFAVMAFWLVRIRFAKSVGRLTLRTPFTPPVLANPPSAARLETEI